MDPTQQQPNNGQQQTIPAPPIQTGTATGKPEPARVHWGWVVGAAAGGLALGIVGTVVVNKIRGGGDDEAAKIKK